MSTILITGTSKGIGYDATLRNPGACDLGEVAPAEVRYAIESDDPRLRLAVGPDALPFLGWRSTVSDEDWVGLGGLSKPDSNERLFSDTGVDLRSKE